MGEKGRQGDGAVEKPEPIESETVVITEEVDDEQTGGEKGVEVLD